MSENKKPTKPIQSRQFCNSNRVEIEYNKDVAPKKSPLKTADCSDLTNSTKESIHSIKYKLTHQCQEDEDSFTESDEESFDELLNAVQLLKPKPEAETTKKKTKSKKKSQPNSCPLSLEFNEYKIFETNSFLEKTVYISAYTTYISESKNAHCMLCCKSLKYDLQIIYEHWRSPHHLFRLSQLHANIYWQEISEPNKFEIYLAFDFIKQDGGTSYWCKTCNEVINSSQSEKLDYASYINHVQTSTHLKNKTSVQKRCRNLHNNIWWAHKSTVFNIEQYYCYFCNKTFGSPNKFTSHINTRKHFNKIKNKNVAIDSCIQCQCLWFGDTEMYIRHCKSHNEESNDLFYVPAEVDDLLIKSLDETDECNTAENDMECTKNILELIEKLVEPLFPQAKAYAFGSRENGLGSKESDFDIFLDCGNFYSSSDSNNVLENMNSIWSLIEDSEEWKRIKKVERSRTPVLTIEHKSTGIHCDITFTNGLSVENTKLIRNYIKAFPMSRHLILFMKKWLKINYLHGSSSITSYAASWLVIFYLQTIAILPSVEELIKQKNKSKIVDGWETGFIETIPQVRTELSFRDLILGMFIFYAEFNFLFNIVCPLTGSIIAKKRFLNIETLPSCMKTYKNHISTYENPEYFRLDSLMGVQDPLDLSHNLTKAVTKTDIFRFQFLCMKTIEKLNETES